MKKIVTISLIAVLLMATMGAAGGQGTITVIMEGFNNDHGYARVALFSSDDGFPEQFQKAFKKDKVKISGSRAKVVFNDVPYGEYAIALYHDEENTGRFERNFLGIPKQGYGVSGIETGFPSFEKSKFPVDTGNVTVEIRLYY
ncbi:MAG: DUF2141 domain-containing protein [Deltaproteobacteria bacterium]|nr:DUF2141 domain-containing protein [Deltaproteobacteria bacterium]